MNLLTNLGRRGDLEDAVEGSEAEHALVVIIAAYLGRCNWCSRAEEVARAGGRCVPSPFELRSEEIMREPWLAPPERPFRVKVLWGRRTEHELESTLAVSGTFPRNQNTA
jgi:hypothetical protein